MAKLFHVTSFVDSIVVQEDPVLIEAVKKLLKPPALPDVPYNISSVIGEGGVGQYGQVRFLSNPKMPLSKFMSQAYYCACSFL